MCILMQFWLRKKKIRRVTNGELVPPLYWRHHGAHNRMPPNQWTLRRATRKNPATTKIPPKQYHGTFNWTPILMYTTIQLKRKNLFSRWFPNTTILQQQRILIPKMRRHWKWQPLKKAMPDVTTTCPSSVLPMESGRATPSPPWDPRCTMCACIISLWKVSRPLSGFWCLTTKPCTLNVLIEHVCRT